VVFVSHLDQIAGFLHRAVTIGLGVQAKTGRLLKDFSAALDTNEEIKVRGLIDHVRWSRQALAADVEAFSKALPMPGFDVASMRYQN